MRGSRSTPHRSVGSSSTPRTTRWSERTTLPWRGAGTSATSRRYEASSSAAAVIACRSTCASSASTPDSRRLGGYCASHLLGLLPDSQRLYTTKPLLHVRIPGHRSLPERCATVRGCDRQIGERQGRAADPFPVGEMPVQDGRKLVEQRIAAFQLHRVGSAPADHLLHQVLVEENADGRGEVLSGPEQPTVHIRTGTGVGRIKTLARCLIRQILHDGARFPQVETV